MKTMTDEYCKFISHADDEASWDGPNTGPCARCGKPLERDESRKPYGWKQFFTFTRDGSEKLFDPGGGCKPFIIPKGPQFSVCHVCVLDVWETKKTAKVTPF